MDIIAGNITIAEFMGKDIRGLVVVDNTFEYHTSWSWLMPVVEKIATIHYGWPSDKMNTKYDDCAYPRTFGMRDAEGNYMVRFNASGLITGKTLIEATWLAVLDFIQWHNSLDT